MVVVLLLFALVVLDSHILLVFALLVSVVALLVSALALVVIQDQQVGGLFRRVGPVRRGGHIEASDDQDERRDPGNGSPSRNRS